MPEATLRGVTIFTKSRRKNAEVFELGISPEGIEIRRPGQDPRLLGWDRVAAWEIEQRKGNVLLVLRGGGSVTPLLIPDWTVDDVDQVLRDMTAHLAQATVPSEEPADLDLPDTVPEEPALEAQFDVDLPAPPDDEPDADPAVALGLPAPLPVEPAGSGRDMDLALPSLPLTESGDPLEDMDLELPPPSAEAEDS